MTHSYKRHDLFAWERHDSFIYISWVLKKLFDDDPLPTYGMTHSYERHDLFV